jgi:hypothetical protein
MDIEHIIYLAGIIDGEGTITIGRQKQYKRETYVFRTWIFVANTFKPLVELLKQRHGGNWALGGKPRTKRYKQGYVWHMLDRETIAPLLRSIMPYLVVKRRQAELVLRFIESRQLQPRGAAYTPEEFRIYETVRDMNRGSKANQKTCGVDLEFLDTGKTATKGR